MASIDSYIIMGIGGFFIVLSLIIFLWAWRKQKTHGDPLSRQEELRSFLGYWPELIEPVGLRAGGCVSIIIGLALFILGIILLFVL